MFPQARVNIQFEITQDLNSCLIWFINTWSCTTWKTFRLSNIFYLKKSLLSWIKWCLILVIAINWLLYIYIMHMYKCHIRVNVFLILLAVLEIIVWILYPICNIYAAILTRMSCIIGYESCFWDDLMSVILITVLMPQCTLTKPTY